MRRLLAIGPLVLAVLLPGSGIARESGIKVPRGFKVDVWARGLSHPTAMAWGPDGRLYVTEVDGAIAAIGPSRRPEPFVRDLTVPLGLAWSDRLLFVSQSGKVERMQLRGSRVIDRRVIAARLPYGLHQQNNILVGRNGRLFLGSGSTCDACRDGDRRSAAVLTMRFDGSDLRVFSRGLRNPYGLAFQPGTNRLYVSVNGRDKLGSRADPEPAEMVVVARRGRWYGWPSCWPNARLLRMSGSCRGVTRPAAYLEPHSSADGMAFYTGTRFPRGYRGNLFVAEWGQYDAHRFGRRVVRIQLGPRGGARRVSTFADGFDHPLAVENDLHGGLLVADWGRGVIYRIRHG
ncbi:MAG: PQQ-dependent sugar dehydrogenase [Actinomycetota bacterium]|nr:PQQ-dependent sugar dehydrogenase [Actinomycetota bacterium]